jgi:primosomal protein N'
MCRIVVRDEDHPKCIATARALAERLTAINARLPGAAPGNRLPTTENAPLRIRGPAPCPIARIADKHRMQIEVLAESAVALQQFLTAARREALIKSDAEMVVDVDPIALL